MDPDHDDLISDQGDPTIHRPAVPAPVAPNPTPTMVPVPPAPPLRPPPPGGAGEGPLGQWQNSQAGQFIRMITNTIREVRERGQSGGGNGGGGPAGGGGFRWDAGQLGGLLQSL